MKVLIIGLGKIARTHIDALRSIDPECTIYALRSDSNAESVDGIRNIFRLEDTPDDIDFFIVSNPTALHAPTIRQLLEFRKPLFIEKPLFESLAHAPLVDAIKETGVQSYVACNLRFYDLLIYLRKYLSENPDIRINEVNAYCGTYLPRYREGSDYRSSYNARIELGGGIHIDMIHDLDYICWLFGLPQSSGALFRNVSSLGIAAPDYAHYTLLYPDFTATVTLNYYRTEPRRTLEIVFDDKIWTADMRAGVITDAQGNTVYKSRNSVADTYRDQMQYFISSIRTRSCMENDAAEALRTLRLALGGDS